MSIKFLATCGALTAAIALTGCSRPAGSGAAQPATAVRDRNVITALELSDPDLRDLNALEIVQRLRPMFFRTRGPQTIMDSASVAARAERLESGKVHASFDGITVIPLDELSTVLASSIREIRYLDASAAMQKFGPRAYAGPVILVSTK